MDLQRGTCHRTSNRRSEAGAVKGWALLSDLLSPGPFSGCIPWALASRFSCAKRHSGVSRESRNPQHHGAVVSAKPGIKHLSAT